METIKKKLIEVALPLDEINAACAREKSIRHGHPSTLHLWWARRPLASARAVIWSSLVDDPSSHPEQFPTEELQTRERERLFSILKQLVVWENTNNQDLLEAAKAEIMKSTNNNPPCFFDPFAGGGTLPLEAQRLGLKTYASDLNPVAVLINKSMLDIPTKYSNCPPVHPKSNYMDNVWHGCQGLAEDVDYYGKKLLEICKEKLKEFYPQVRTKTGEKYTVAAWIWARTVECGNPACKCKMPLIHSTDLLKKKGREKHIELEWNGEKQFSFKIKDGLSTSIKATVSRSGGIICPICGQPMDFEYLRTMGKTKGFGEQLITIVVEGPKGILFLSPDDCILEKEKELPPIDIPEGKISYYPGCLNTNEYGFTTFGSLYTNRQLVMMNTFIETLDEIEAMVSCDIKSSNRSIESEYTKAIRTYLAFTIDKLAKFHSSFCSWDNTMGKITGMFGRQAISMVWDFAEANPFSNSSGSYVNSVLDYVVKAIKLLPEKGILGGVTQWDATQDVGLRSIMVSTDPPYYDNIPYAYIADYFYVWMRKALKNTYPEFFRTILTPKDNELTAIRYRFDGGKDEAKVFFENGMERTCQNLALYSREDVPVTIYYAFKQSESDDQGEASTGWETMLSAIIKSGFIITGTWPMRTEVTNTIKKDWAALSTSVVIVCRKSAVSKENIDLRTFLDILKAEMIPALKKLQASNIAPVDLAQSAIGPGIAVYSRYNAIIQNDGSVLTVRDALKIINRQLDQYLNDVNFDMDVETSLALTMYQQKAFDVWSFGDVNNLANSKNISVERMVSAGFVESVKSKVSLKERSELIPFSAIGYMSSRSLWLLTQQTVKAMEEKGNEGVAEIFSVVDAPVQDQIKALCYQLFLIADRSGWTEEALAYNALITSWDESISAVKLIEEKKKEAVQMDLFD